MLINRLLNTAELTSTMQRSTESAAEYQDQKDPMASGKPLSPNAHITQRADEVPKINSISDLHSYGEISGTITTTEGGITHVNCTFASFIDSDGRCFYGETQVNQHNLTPQLLRECLKRISDEDISHQT